MSSNQQCPESKWIDAFSDPFASLYTFPSCISLADLNGDGDHELIIADLGTGQYDIKLKVYKGVTLLIENSLDDLPSAVCCFFMDQVQSSAPAIAVASGRSIFVYKNLKPYYKYNLPSMKVNETEKQVWTHIAKGELDVKSLSDVLLTLKEQIHLYQGLFLVDLIKLDDIATSLKFGKFGREEGALIIATKSGGLVVKLFKRTAKLEEKSQLVGPPRAQSHKLNVPKKTRIFVDQMLREKDGATRMHQVFQRDLFLLRLHTTRIYHSILARNMQSSSSLLISASVLGFGPLFRLVVHLRSSDASANNDIDMLLFRFNTRLYRIDPALVNVPLLVPCVGYDFQVDVKCLTPDKSLSDDVAVLAVKRGQSTPILTAIVAMPVSEQSPL